MCQQRPCGPGNGVTGLVLATADDQFHIRQNLVAGGPCASQDSDDRDTVERVGIRRACSKIGKPRVDRVVKCRHGRKASRLGIGIPGIV